jgi:chromosome segregation ATPase
MSETSGSDDITELERRLTAAMDRIGQGVEALSERAADATDATETAASEAGCGDDTAPPAGGGDDAGGEDVARLRQELEDERLVSAQLEERIKALHRKHDARMAELEKDLGAARTALSEMGEALETLKAKSDALHRDAEALRAAEGKAGADLLDNSLRDELETLRAARAADVAEARAIKAALEPLLSDDAKEAN